MKRTILSTLACLLLCSAYADQHQLLDKPIAEAAVAKLRSESEIISYCGCCDEFVPVVVRLDSVWMVASDYAPYYSVWAAAAEVDPETGENDFYEWDIDLAYIWLVRGDTAVNLALAMGLECDPCAPNFRWNTFEPIFPALDIPASQSAPLKITVSDAQGLMDAIGPNRTITLMPGVYDLLTVKTTASTYATLHEPIMALPYWEVYGVAGMRLKAKGRVIMQTEQRLHSHLVFARCGDITIDGITFGDTSHPGAQYGLTFRESADVIVRNCLFTSGAVSGIELYQCRDVEVVKCVAALYQLLIDAAGVNMLSVDRCRFQSPGESQHYPFQILASNASIRRCRFTDFASRALAKVDALTSLDVQNLKCRESTFVNATFGEPRHLTTKGGNCKFYEFRLVYE